MVFVRQMHERVHILIYAERVQLEQHPIAQCIANCMYIMNCLHYCIVERKQQLQEVDVIKWEISKAYTIYPLDQFHHHSNHVRIAKCFIANLCLLQVIDM